MSSFVKAQRSQAKLKIAITGPSGSGKTYSSLLMAKGIGQKIALIDTENASASLYADKFDFDTLVIEPPYTIQKYNEAVKAAVQAGYDVLVIDSLSHAWAGDGGLLTKKEALDARGGNSFSNWGQITKEQEQFKSTLLNADIHMVCTMRSKQDYVLETNDKGKSAPRKVGLAPIQRDGMEYEFTTVFDVAMDHNAQVSKDRTGLFDGKIFTIDASTGQTFMKWLSGAKVVAPKPVALVPNELDAALAKEPAQTGFPRQPAGSTVTDKQIKRLFAIAHHNQWSNEDVKDFMKSKWGLESTKELDRSKYDDLCKAIEGPK